MLFDSAFSTAAQETKSCQLDCPECRLRRQQVALARLALRSSTTGFDEARMMQSRQLPPMPEIGRPESYYAKLSHEADRVGDRHAREANKVGQYVTLAMDPHLTWEEKLKYFQ